MITAELFFPALTVGFFKQIIAEPPCFHSECMVLSRGIPETN